jgi:hypothetical protein
MKRLHTLILLAILQLPMLSKAQFVTSTQTIGAGANQMDISVTMDVSVGQLKFEMTGPLNVWFAFSFNTATMSPGSYTIVANVSGGNPAEYLMQNYAAPILQNNQNLTGVTSSVISGRKHYIFYRNITTGDPNDYIFQAVPGNLNIAWAYGLTSAMGNHDDRGSSVLTFSNPCSSLPTTTLPALYLCEGDTAMVFGQPQTVSGNYTAIYPISWDCDSVVMQPVFFSISVTTIEDTFFLDLCHGDSTLIGGSWITSPGYYTVFRTKFGCDSILDLYIVSSFFIDTTITTSGNTLNAMPGYGGYQWIDCSTGQTAQGSGDSSNFTPLVSGIYRVLIFQLGCTALSGCHSIIANGIQDASLSKAEILVYPNPAEDMIYIESAYMISEIQIIDKAGKEIRNMLIDSQGVIPISIIELNPGIYHLQIITEDGILRKRFIKAL